MRYSLYLLIPILFLSSFVGPDKDPRPTKWVISKGCSLKVNGSTNVNKFTCVISNTFTPDTITFSRRADSETSTITGMLRLNVRDFDCYNPVMTADLRKTLKTKEYPQMVIRFLSLSRYPESSSKPYLVTGLVSIELAGVAKKFNVTYTITPTGKNTLLLKAVREINFSDFNIVPPRKLGGMIQTSDKLLAEFNLAMQVLN